jgi:hypothetical protein
MYLFVILFFLLYARVSRIFDGALLTIIVTTRNVVVEFSISSNILTHAIVRVV